MEYFLYECFGHTMSMTTQFMCKPMYLMYAVPQGLFWQRIQSCQLIHYSDAMTSAMASLITSLTIVYSTVYSGEDKKTHKSSASLAFVRGIHNWPVNSPHKWPVTRKMFPFDAVIMWSLAIHISAKWIAAHCRKQRGRIANDIAMN